MNRTPKLILLLGPLFLSIIQACNSASTAPVKKEIAVSKAEIKKAKTIQGISDTDLNQEVPNDYAEYYVVIADTGENYLSLQQTMLALSKTTGIKIDTLDRSYRSDKNLIALPDNYDDDIYAGDYYPRRSPGTFLSIEYLNLYKEDSPEKMMALISGIYENKSSADSALEVVNNTKMYAFIQKTKMYIGCIH